MASLLETYDHICRTNAQLRNVLEAPHRAWLERRRAQAGHPGRPPWADALDVAPAGPPRADLLEGPPLAAVSDGSLEAVAFVVPDPIVRAWVHRDLPTLTPPPRMFSNVAELMASQSERGRAVVLLMSKLDTSELKALLARSERAPVLVFSRSPAPGELVGLDPARDIHLLWGPASELLQSIIDALPPQADGR